MKYLAIKFSLKNIVLFDFLRGYRLTTMALLYVSELQKQFINSFETMKLFFVMYLLRFWVK